MGKQEWDRQVKEMATVIKEVEGDDERTYEGQLGRAETTVDPSSSSSSSSSSSVSRTEGPAPESKKVR